MSHAAIPDVPLAFLCCLFEKGGSPFTQNNQLYEKVTRS